MNDVEKRLNLKINIPDARTVEKLSKDLDSIEKKINNITSKKTSSSKDSAMLASLRAQRDILSDQLKEASELANIFDRIGKGQKVSADEQRKATRVLNDQVKAAREMSEYEERLNKFTKKATGRTKRAWLQSELMKAGYSMADANVYSAKGLTPDDVAQIQDDASKSAVKAGNQIASAVIGGAKAVNEIFRKTTGLSLSIKDNFNDVLSNVEQALSRTAGMASYDVGTSLFTNRSARELQLRYGLSGSQAYGFQQASSLLGLDTSSLTDYMYMNERQREVFNSYMQRSSAWYDKLNSSGVLGNVQELQLEFSLMKQELSMQFLSFLATNKDTIMGLMQGIFDAASGILSWLDGSKFNLVGAVDSLLGGSSSSSKTININVDSNNTATGVITSQQGLQDQFDTWGMNLAAQIASAL